MGVFGTIGKALKGGAGVVGDVAKTAAPFVGMIPGVGTAVAPIIGGAGEGLSELGHGTKFNPGAILGHAVAGLGGNIAGKALGSSGASSGILSKIGGALKSPGMFGNAEGGLDLGKIMGAGAGVANVVGAGQQRKQAQNYNNSTIDIRNQLMSKILAGSPTGLPSSTQQNTMTGASY